MSTAAIAGQSGTHAVSGRGNDVHGQGSRGGARNSVSAAPPPNSSITCAFDSLLQEAAAIRSLTTAAAINGLKKTNALEETISKLELHSEEGSIPKTLLVVLPKAFSILNGDLSSGVVAAKAALEKELLESAIVQRKSELAAAISATVDPLSAFVGDFKKAISYDSLPRDLKIEADKVIRAQSSLLQLQWLQAKANEQSKSEQAGLDRIRKAEAEAAKAMELEQMPTRQLLDDLVKKQVAAALKAHNKASSSVDPNPNPNPNGGGQAKGGVGKKKGKKGNPKANTSNSNKGKNGKGNQSKPKNAQRKGQ
jgi:hypothetical protein